MVSLFLDMASNPMTDPWDWYIYLPIYHKNQRTHASEYTIVPWIRHGKVSGANLHSLQHLRTSVAATVQVCLDPGEVGFFAGRWGDYYLVTCPGNYVNQLTSIPPKREKEHRISKLANKSGGSVRSKDEGLGQSDGLNRF